jgi:hypothetical protein
MIICHAGWRVNLKIINIQERAVKSLPFLEAQLCFDDAFHRAHIFAARGIEVSDAFHTSCRVNDVDAIAFGDRFGWAFW